MSKTLPEIKTPWGEIGYITYKRTYARRLKESDPHSPTEEFHQTIDRIIKSTDKQLNVGFSEGEKEELRTYLLELKGSVAGRFLWQLGTKTVDKLGLPSLQNCAATVVDHPIRPFTWTMEMLMLGSGVGYNIQKEYVYQLPKVVKKKIKIKRQDDASADFIVPDTREGWVKLLGKVLKAHFYSGESFSYSTQLIRGKGAPIKGFGGTASGAEVLCKGMEDINELLNNSAGRKLRPIDVLDVMNIIGSIVVAGNVRRSAQIAIGDFDDLEFLKAKRWDLGSVPNWRAMSNNSVACDDTTKLPQEFWDTYNQGEPYGLINLELSRKVGRIGEVEYPDPDVVSYNPCAEQSLNNNETCCLAELFLPNINSKEELLKVAKYLYRINKHSLSLKSSVKETEAIVHKNMRMGIGVTGLMECEEEKLSWLSDTYKELRKYDKEYSKKMGWPESIKLTTVKPSGTLSLLAGVTAGAHPSPAGEHYIRRIRMASDLPLLDLCRQRGYKVEPLKNFDGSNDPTTSVVEFPCKVPEGTPIAGEISAIEHLEYTKRLQAEWSDNSVSCSIYYNKEEIPEIKKWLAENYTDNVKTVSFMLYHGHGFDQAPYETITKEAYDEMKKNVTPINSVEQLSEGTFDLEECATGACPVK